MADKVTLTDVTLREYGQSVPLSHLHVFTSEIRIEIARELIHAGFRRMELLSCVHPGVAPAMNREDIRKVVSGLGKAEGVELVTLVPNEEGYRSFLRLGLGPEGYNHTVGVFFFRCGSP